MAENNEKKAPDQEEKGKQKKTAEDPGALLRDLCKGTLRLLAPIRAHDQDVTELQFDFCGLTSEELLDALDSDRDYSNIFGISNRQALALFAYTCAKNAPVTEDGGMKTRLYDEKDVLRRIGPADSVKAMQLAKLFYNASSRAGSNNISRE